jgi:iron complex transport system substrate-binding protein
MVIKTPTLYITLFAFVLGWWYLAFHSSTIPSDVVISPRQISLAEISPSSPYLNPLSRSKLHQALLGDTELMISLMAEWDTEARLLTTCVNSDIQRLPNDKYLKAQLLGRRIQARKYGVETTPYPEQFYDISDDAGIIHKTKQRERFLPQTYVAASFLLALTDPQQIVALPRGFRDLNEMFPKELLNRIPVDCGAYQTETLLKLSPDLAFVAPYSMPSTRQVLAEQGVELFTISNINTLEEVQDALIRVGEIAGKPEEAELLSLFMEAAVYALDNRLLVAPKRHWEVLYLNHFSKFSVPTRHTLMGSILSRLRINDFPLFNFSERRWQIPVEHEKLVRLNPQAIILSATSGTELKDLLMQHPAFRNIPAVKKGQIFTLAACVQDSPSQFAVLAYYDIVNALLEVCNP